MALSKITYNQWNVSTSRGTFAIIEGDEHTAQMLSDFQTDPEKLAQFESLIQQYGAARAYFEYNGLPVPISLLETP